MVDGLRTALPDDARDLLDQGLEEVGYTDAHRELYARTLYQDIDRKHFEVRDEFPHVDPRPDSRWGEEGSVRNQYRCL